MATFWAILPAALSGLVLAAHFLRRGQWPGLLAGLALVALLFVRRPWARRAVQAGLALATVEWIRTWAVLSGAREAAGESAGRLTAILLAVAGVAAVGVMLLETRVARRRFGTR
jgi:hypothetical protein